MRKYRKGTKLKYVGTSNEYAARNFETGNIYTVGYAKPYGYYSFQELNPWKDILKSFVENPENFKVGGIPKWKKFIKTGKVI